MISPDECLKWLREFVPESIKNYYCGLSIDEVIKRLLSLNVVQTVALADVAISHLGHSDGFAIKRNEHDDGVFMNEKEHGGCDKELKANIRILEKELHEERTEKNKWRLYAKPWQVHGESLEKKRVV